MDLVMVMDLVIEAAVASLVNGLVRTKVLASQFLT